MFLGKLSKTVKVVCCMTKEGLGIADIWRRMIRDFKALMTWNIQKAAGRICVHVLQYSYETVCIS